MRLLGHLVRWTALGSVVGVLAGASAAGFLVTLDWATETREEHGWLLFLLPVAGFVVGLAYHRLGSTSAGGNNLILDEIHERRAWIPRRMAPLVFVGTVLTHLCGGSAGREGTAIQMSGSLTDAFNRVAHRIARLDDDDRRLLLIAAIGGGFGAVFGVPVAGMVFALEVQAIGTLRYDALVPTLAASVVGDLVVRALGVHHTALPTIGPVDLQPLLLAQVALAGVVFGLASTAFTQLTHRLKALFARTALWPPLRPVVGGLAVIALTYLVGSRDYLGLSIPLITQALAGGAGVVLFAFALKILFTAVTLGSGFQGGEVTPLFVIGATLGASLGRLLGVPVPLMAAIGFVAVFAGAANTPLACIVMGVELFGAAPMVPMAVACVTSYLCSSHHGIYSSQRLGQAKAPRSGSSSDPASGRAPGG